MARLHLPKLEFAPRTILDYLSIRFPRIDRQVWHERFQRGRVLLDDGVALEPDAPYRHGITILYSREIADEPLPLEGETILHRDADILIADKPHGMVVTPSGDHVERSLLFRLQQSTGLAALAPMHRLDRETAGVALFAVREEARAPYHRLFSDGIIEREYLAVAELHNPSNSTEWTVRNRLEEGEPWFRRRIGTDIEEGTANAITHIELLESCNGCGLFRLRPETGKKHQLRVHMASIGCPIVGDRLYPKLRGDPSSGPPLQLLARRLSFNDPRSGQLREFTSGRKLQWPPLLGPLLQPMD